MTRVLISLGSNLGNRRRNLQQAIERLTKVPGIRVSAVSRFLETAPVGGPSQGKYLNAAASLATSLSPEKLLSVFKELEKKGGRKPGFRFGPRPIDIDLVFYGSRVIATSHLKVPHAKLLQRCFVLDPLAEIAPNFVHPCSLKTVKELRESLKNGAGVG